MDKLNGTLLSFCVFTGQCFRFFMPYGGGAIFGWVWLSMVRAPDLAPHLYYSICMFLVTVAIVGLLYVDIKRIRSHFGWAQEELCAEDCKCACHN